LHFGIAPHVHVHGSPIGYAGIAIAAFVTWAGLPGAGEAALITGAAFAARHRLDIGAVEIAAFTGAIAGGIVGWLAGWRAGAAVAGAPGPLYRLRRRGLQAGERFFDRFGVLAVFLTPSWVAGIHRVKPARYLPANALAALVWTLGIGLGTFFAGPSVAEGIGDIGTYGLLAVVAVALVAGAIALTRHRHAHRLSGFGDRLPGNDKRMEVPDTPLGPQAPEPSPPGAPDVPGAPVPSPDPKGPETPDSDPDD
jgi:membrane protein DedA with SNARE-associated domain